jgi:hypothetical protein
MRVGIDFARSARTMMRIVPLSIGVVIASVALTTAADQTRLRRSSSQPLHGVRASHPRVTAGAGNVQYYGGHVISHVQVVNVNWGANVASVATSGMPGFYTAITNSSYFDWMGEYDTAGKTPQDGMPGSNQHIYRGTFLRSVTITPQNANTSLVDTDIQTELVAQIGSGALPAPQIDPEGGVNTLYMINFPPGISITDPSGNTSCQQFCAYHGTTQVSGVASGVPYGVMPDLSSGACSQGCGGGATALDAYTSTASHELGEAVTDTEIGLSSGGSLRPIAWYDQQGGEIGDICVVASSFVQLAGFTVQALWSQRLGQCVSEDPTLPLCGAQRPCRPCGASDNGQACNGGTPVCQTTPSNPQFGQCVACTANAACTNPMKPICDTTTNTCRGCSMNSDCAAPAPKCDTQTGQCVACLANADCTSPATPTCDPTSKTCVGCASKSDCPNGTCATNPSDPNKGKCVQCQTNTDCPANQACDPGNDTCVGCNSNSDCKNPSTPVCNSGSHTCVGSGSGPGSGSDAGSGAPNPFGNGNGNGNGGGGGGNGANGGGTGSSGGCALTPTGGTGVPLAFGFMGALVALTAFRRRRRD